MNDIRQDQAARKALLELAETVEQLTGPDRAVDWAIHLLDGLDGVGMYGAHPPYTASLDAAMTLVPDGYVWSLLSTGAARLDSIYTEGKNSEALGADSPSAALTAASLRARAELLA